MSSKGAPEGEDDEGAPVAAEAASSDGASVVLLFRVPADLEGQRLDRFLEWRIPRLTRERAREIVEACARREDGSPRAPSERVRAGETVRLVRERFREPDAPRSFGILHHDRALLVVDKPAGLPVHPSATYHRNTLKSLLVERWGEGAPHMAHRLDKETSGVVACAPPGPFEVRLKAQFAARTVAKTYLAVVRGVLEGAGTIDRPLGRATSGLHLRMEPRDDGVEAITSYEALEHRGDRTLVRLTPHTGRQHQLRVHLAAIGHPILGDKLYGPGAAEIFLDVMREGLTEARLALLGHTRQALHAHRLELDHPETGERMAFVSPLPDELAQLLERGARAPIALDDLNSQTDRGRSRDDAPPRRGDGAR